MGNCCIRMKLVGNRLSHRRRRKKIVLLLVGLDNAGKTTAAKGLAKDKNDDTVPTVGFSSLTLLHKGYKVVIYDLGGGSQIRGIWNQYFVDVHGIIYVVDASDTSRIDESRLVLEELLTHEKLAGKPLLLLANKQDREGALDEIDVVERLNLEGIVNRQRCPTLVETCSALSTNSRRRKKPYLDPGIHNGYRWLLSIIIKDFVEVDGRVEADTRAAWQQVEKEKEERRKRVEVRRKEREEAEGTKIIPLRDDSHESMNGKIINVKALSAETEEHSLEVIELDSKSKHLSDSHDSGYTAHYNDADGDKVSLMTVHSHESAVQSEVKRKCDSSNKPGDSFLSSPSLKGIVKENLEMEGNFGTRKKFKLTKRSNKTAPAPTRMLLQGNPEDMTGEALALHPGRRLPPLTPPANRTKMFEVNSVKRLRLLKSLSLSFSEDDADEKTLKEKPEVVTSSKALNHCSNTSTTSKVKEGFTSKGDTYSGHPPLIGAVIISSENAEEGKAIMNEVSLQCAE